MVILRIILIIFVIVIIDMCLNNMLWNFTKSIIHMLKHSEINITYSTVSPLSTGKPEEYMISENYGVSDYDTNPDTTTSQYSIYKTNLGTKNTYIWEMIDQINEELINIILDDTIIQYDFTTYIPNHETVPNIYSPNKFRDLIGDALSFTYSLSLTRIIIDSIDQSKTTEGEFIRVAEENKSPKMR